MTEIRQNTTIVTLINVFAVAPENQQQLADVLVEATATVMKKLPGFISANIHKSLDGTHVVNYAQWRSQEDFEKMLATQMQYHTCDRLLKLPSPSNHYSATLSPLMGYMRETFRVPGSRSKCRGGMFYFQNSSQRRQRP